MCSVERIIEALEREEEQEKLLLDGKKLQFKTDIKNTSIKELENLREKYIEINIRDVNEYSQNKEMMLVYKFIEFMKTEWGLI